MKRTDIKQYFAQCNSSTNQEPIKRGQTHRRLALFIPTPREQELIRKAEQLIEPTT